MARGQDGGLWARFLQRVVGRALDRVEDVRQRVQGGAKVILGCPECGTRYSVRQGEAGRGVKCPKCNVVLPLDGSAEGSAGKAPPAPKAARPPAGAALPRPGVWPFGTMFAWGRAPRLDRLP